MGDFFSRFICPHLGRVINAKVQYGDDGGEYCILNRKKDQISLVQHAFHDANCVITERQEEGICTETPRRAMMANDASSYRCRCHFNMVHCIVHSVFHIH